MTRKILLTAALSLGLAANANAVFIGDGSGNLFELDVDTNVSSLIGNGGVTMFDIAMDPISQMLYGVSGGGTLYSIDKSDGSISSIGSTGSSINGLTFSSSGTLYGSGGSNLYTINTLSGLSSLVGNTGYSSSGDLAFDDMGTLYMSASGGGTDRLIELDALTGAGSLIGNIGFSSVYGLNYSDSTLFGFTAGQQTISIDVSTGLGSLLTSNGINTYGADGVGGVENPVPVAEPSHLGLTLLALLGIIGWRRRF